MLLLGTVTILCSKLDVVVLWGSNNVQRMCFHGKMKLMNCVRKNMFDDVKVVLQEARVVWALSLQTNWQFHLLTHISKALILVRWLPSSSALSMPPARRSMQDWPIFHSFVNSLGTGRWLDPKLQTLQNWDEGYDAKSISYQMICPKFVYALFLYS